MLIPLWKQNSDTWKPMKAERLVSKMAIIIDFKTRKTLDRSASQAQYISKCGNFDYAELFNLIVGRGFDFDWKQAVGLSRNQLLNRLKGKVAFNLAEMERLIEFLNIPDSEVSRVFFKAV